MIMTCVFPLRIYTKALFRQHLPTPRKNANPIEKFIGARHVIRENLKLHRFNFWRAIMMNKNADGLAWLRETRRQIAEECGNDPKLMGDYFRSFRKQYEERIVRDSDTEILCERKAA